MTSTKQTSRAGRRLGLLLLTILVASCSGDGGSSGNGGTDTNGEMRAAVLAALGENVVVPAQESFDALAEVLASELGAASDGTGSRADAQDAWREAMVAWQALEVMQFGPAGNSVTVMGIPPVLGGQDFRARIYAPPPTLNLCLIDQITVGSDYDDPDALDATPGVPRGLGAIEYLLFNEDSGNNCTALNTINSDGTWDDLASEIPSRRLAYAGALATLVRRAAGGLVDAWAPAGGNFIDELINPTRSGAVYGSAQEGLNSISTAMFYLEADTKDAKVGKPSGITDCPATEQPCVFESIWASQSKENVLANLEAFRTLFVGGTRDGGDALGFDDLLAEMGAGDFAEEMVIAVDRAIQSVAAIPTILEEAVASDPQSPEIAEEAIDMVTDELRSRFLSVLEFELPERVAGDND
ncbi:MAG: imelysin family protein [Polyangiales bacterium]